MQIAYIREKLDEYALSNQKNNEIEINETQTTDETEELKKYYANSIRQIKEIHYHERYEILKERDRQRSLWVNRTNIARKMCDVQSVSKVLRRQERILEFALTYLKPEKSVSHQGSTAFFNEGTRYVDIKRSRLNKLETPHDDAETCSTTFLSTLRYKKS